MNDSYTWAIVEKCSETSDVETLILKAQHERPHFTAGQYLTVRLPGFEPAEGKSYSISSSPKDECVSLTIKKMGNFSQALLSHMVGDTLTTSAPYGFFYPEQDEPRDLVFIVGGIGITPCMSIIATLLNENFQHTITLFYSNKTVADIVFYERIDELKKVHARFTPHYFITQETSIAQGMYAGRITGEHVTSLLNQKTTDTDFFLCGSIDFTKSLWTSLRAQGIQSPQIYTEGFF